MKDIQGVLLALILGIVIIIAPIYFYSTHIEDSSDIKVENISEHNEESDKTSTDKKNDNKQEAIKLMATLGISKSTYQPAIYNINDEKAKMKAKSTGISFDAKDAIITLNLVGDKIKLKNPPNISIDFFNDGDYNSSRIGHIQGDMSGENGMFEYNFIDFFKKKNIDDSVYCSITITFELDNNKFIIITNATATK